MHEFQVEGLMDFKWPEAHRVEWARLRLGDLKLWIWGDAHWNERRPQIMSRKPDFEQVVREGWKQSVGRQDIVLDLGDVIMGRYRDLEEKIRPLPGKKWLIRGNHDHQPASWYLDRGYDAVFDQLILGPEVLGYQRGDEHLEEPNDHRIVFSHRPLEKRQMPNGVRLNVHGHVHLQGIDDKYRRSNPHAEAFVLEHELKPVLLHTWLEAKGRLLPGGWTDAKRKEEREKEVNDKDKTRTVFRTPGQGPMQTEARSGSP